MRKIIVMVAISIHFAWLPNKTNTIMGNRAIERIVHADGFRMGDMHVKQPLPTRGLNKVGPFILLHHAGPKEVKAGSKKFRIEPHPHRGFEPVTFIFDGLIEHYDSEGNHGLLDSGDVQWTTAGSGIVHSEGPPEAFFKEGGTVEIIQLWVNLPKAHKMTAPKYQDIKNESIPVISESDGNIKINLVAGEYKNQKGPGQSFTPMTMMTVYGKENASTSFSFPANWSTMLYVLDGELIVNGDKTVKKEHMVVFDGTGESFDVLISEDAKFLVLSGEPINEPLVSHGPFVMNSFEEINQAIDDYEAGKMGVLTK